MSRMLEAGDQVLLVDNKKRRYLVTLEAGGEFHSHTGVLNHDDLIGCPEGATPKSSRGSSFVAFRPTLSDFILKMPRGAQVIYPKDLGPLLLLADIFPGAKVFESGVGSGALSMTMLRAGAEITGYDIRDEFVERARSNVSTMLGEEALGRYTVEIRDAYDGIDLVDLDRVVLDLPEPWQVVPHAAQSLQAGGIIVAYTPSILQAVRFREALTANGFEFAETIEVLNRSWHIDGLAVRPDHRMVAHTGFLSHARLLGS
ncbi:MAG: tRNA (adenine-N1)-methyltransferase [Acidimicrobiales bacterium]|nr:tRNA (adenine-N1)-methyltransferase [Acidimicrobiales bacterium]